MRPMHASYRIMSGKWEKQKYVEFTDTLGRFAKTASDAGTKVLVVLIPDAVQLGDPHMQAVNEFVARAAEEIGVQFIDMTPILEADDDYTSLYLFPFDAHNSPKGLKKIAEAIADKIVELALLQDAGS